MKAKIYDDGSSYCWTPEMGKTVSSSASANQPLVHLGGVCNRCGLNKTTVSHKVW